MANINKIKLSGTTYNIQDLSAAKTVELTQAQYDALVSGGTVDPNTFYVITDAQGADLSNYYTKSETSGATQISTALASKQTTLTAGTGIDITDNVISATGGGGSITIDTSLDSGSTNAVANSAITLSLENKANLSDVVLYNYGNSSTYSSAFVGGKTAYRIVVNITSAVIWYFRVFDGSNFVYYGVNNSGNLFDNNGNQIDAPYFINTDLTNYSSGTFDICFNTDNVYADYFANTSENTFTIYESISIKPLKTQVIENTTALAGKQDTLTASTGIDITNNVISVSGVVETSAITTSVTSSSTDAQVPSAKAVYDMVGNINTILESI